MFDPTARFTSPFTRWENETQTATMVLAKINSTLRPCRAVRVYNPATNTEALLCGSANLTSANATIVLEPGDHVVIAIDDPQKIFVLAETTSVTFAYTVILA